MTDIFRTMILPADTAQLARDIASTLSAAGAGMWTTGLSSDNTTVSHYISTGFVSPDFAYMLPEQFWQQDAEGVWQAQQDSTLGNPQAVYEACLAVGMQVELSDIQAAFDTADVTSQEPFVAMQRLGLSLFTPVESDN